MAASPPKVYIIGVGMTKFEKPGQRQNFDYHQMAAEAVTKALQDARIPQACVEQACVGYVFGDSTCGQKALYDVGIYGIPVFNVNNNCSTGSTALLMAKHILESGNINCALALGFEKMEKGSLTSKFHDRTNPLDRHVKVMTDMAGLENASIAAQFFGNAGKEHMDKFGTTLEHFAKIAYKNHKHSTNNPYAQFQEYYSLEQIMSSPHVYGPLTKLQCCPTSDGSAAAILCTEKFVVRHNLQAQAVLIVGMEMATDPPSTFTSNSLINLVGYEMTHNAAIKLFSKAALKPTDVDVVELHDCFSANELITYEALGLCPPGKAAEFIDSGNNTYGGRHVINPSGGLISKGHPLGATGLAQCAELCWQLRGQAGRRQVSNARLALQHNIGLGGAVVVALYQLGFPQYQGILSYVQVNLTSATDQTSELEATNVTNLLARSKESGERNFYRKVKKTYCFNLKSSAGYTDKEKVEYNEKPDPTCIKENWTGLIYGRFNFQSNPLKQRISTQGKKSLKPPDFQMNEAKSLQRIQSKL